jgi:hypothetical protein
VGCFFLAKLCGGGREVTNATDAGTLNVAKQALRSSYVETPAPADFMALADPQYSGQITLYTYNRAVAQALLVALNAQQENTGTALANAATTFGYLNTVGTGLTTLLRNSSTLNNQFTVVADGNSMKMYGNNTISEAMGGYNYAYMKPGGSTNIWFSSASFPGAPAASLSSLNLVASVALDKTPSMVGDVGAYQDKYMVGYQSIAVPGVGSVMGVPVFPQQTPHLVRLADFQTAATAPAATVPPNAFCVQSQNLDCKSSTTGGAIACAIVGCAYAAGVNNPVTSPVDFVGCIPGGYILLANRSAAPVPAGWSGPVDSSNNIFNHELGDAPGIESTQSGPNDVFTLDSGAGAQSLQQWAAYNAAGDPASTPWTDPTTGLPTTGAPQIPSGVFASTSGGGSAPATAADMKLVTNSGLNCLTDDLDVNNYLADPRCAGALNSFCSAYGRAPLGGSASGSGPVTMWTNVDTIKADIIDGFRDGNSEITVDAPAAPSGMGAYKNGFSNTPWYPGGPTAATPPLENTNSTAWDLLNQVGGCAVSSVVADLTQRANEIVPGVAAGTVSSPACTSASASSGSIVGLLKNSPPMSMGTAVFICKQTPNDPTSPLVIQSASPSTYVSGPGGVMPTADGSTTGGSSEICNGGAYNLLSDEMIDSISPNGTDKGDNNLHDRPYRSISNTGTGDLAAEDHADFILSSGYQNLLGKLDFYQTTTGGDTFSRPN